MEPREYVDARWSALVRAAVLLGAAEEDAPDLVRRVLSDNQRRIRRAPDPDPLVHRALAAAIPRSDRTRFGQEQDLEARRAMLIDSDPDEVVAQVPADPPVRQRRRPWLPVAAAVTALVGGGVAVAVVAATGGGPDPPDDRLRADQVPSLFGYDDAAARALLESRGLDVIVEPLRACDVMDRVVTTDPPTGATYQRGDPITVYVAVPPDVACLTNYQDIETAWQLVDFANGRGPAPDFAGRVIVYVGDGPRVVLTRADDRTRWDATGVLAGVRRATERVALVDDDPVTYSLPTLSVRDSTSATDGCGSPDPPVAAPGEALSITIGAPAEGTSCPVRVDLFRNRGRIDAVAFYPALS